MKKSNTKKVISFKISIAKKQYLNNAEHFFIFADNINDALVKGEEIVKEQYTGNHITAIQADDYIY